MIINYIKLLIRSQQTKLGVEIANKNITVRVDMDCDSNLLLSNITILPNPDITVKNGLCGGKD